MRRHSVSILRSVLCTRAALWLLVVWSVLSIGVPDACADQPGFGVSDDEETCTLEAGGLVRAAAAAGAASDNDKATKDEYGDVTQEELNKTGEGPKKETRDEYGNVTEAEAAGAEEPKVADPLERYNRAMFKFNDRFYFWVFEPVARGYKKVVPEDFRVLFNNFYKNITSPIRIVNSLLQFKLQDAGVDLTRLVVNSTVGVGGLRDVGSCMGLNDHDEDFGQTLGFYGFGPGFYFVWPFLGPSTARDSVGMGGDLLLNPTFYLPLYPAFGLNAHQRVNGLSFHLGEYEALKKASVDPYIALRSAYYQNRQAAIMK